MSKKEPIALIDLDNWKYGIASVGETRYVDVTHIPSGRVKEFENKTAFYGRNTKGGWLKELNDKQLEKGLPIFSVDQFEIVQKQKLKDEPIEFLLHSAKLSVETALKASGAGSFEGYIGKGDSFRVELSTLQKYKGKREHAVKPLLLKEITEYLQKKFKAEVIEFWENDDKLVMRYLELEKKGISSFILGGDKDYYGCEVKFYNVNHPEEGVVDCRGFGSLWLENGNKVRGKGRLFKCWQICNGDGSDDYKANEHSDTKWGELGAYKALKDCTDDKQAWQVLVDTFKMLYPEPKEIVTWKNEEITIDWLYCLQEMTNMAHLHRKQDDFLDVITILDKLKVDYGNYNKGGCSK